MEEQRLVELLQELQTKYPYLVCAACSSPGDDPVVFLGKELYPENKPMKEQATNVRTYLFLRQSIDQTFKSFYQSEKTTP